MVNMALPIFTPICRELDDERTNLLDYIARTAYATKHGQVQSDMGIERINVAIATLDRIEHICEELKDVEGRIEAILPASKRTKKIVFVSTEQRSE